MTEQTETRGDPRLDFLQELTLKCLRLKPDKWARMIVSDEQRCFIQSFIEKGKVDYGGKLLLIYFWDLEL